MNIPLVDVVGDDDDDDDEDRDEIIAATPVNNRNMQNKTADNEEKNKTVTLFLTPAIKSINDDE